MKLKNKILIIALLFAMTFNIVGCTNVTYHENGVPSYFLEPEGYIIAKVEVENDSFLLRSYKYGYILEEDYQDYLNGKTDGILIVKHPYEHEKEVTTSFGKIISIEIGVYEDRR